MAKQDFGKILDQWEKLNKNRKLTIDKEADSKTGTKRNHIEKDQLDALIDLHGLSMQEAEEELTIFMRQAKKNDCHKLLIIHGKGIHSNGDPVLSHLVQNFLKKYSYAKIVKYMNNGKNDQGSTLIII